MEEKGLLKLFLSGHSPGMECRAKTQMRTGSLIKEECNLLNHLVSGSARFLVHSRPNPGIVSPILISLNAIAYRYYQSKVSNSLIYGLSSMVSCCLLCKFKYMYTYVYIHIYIFMQCQIFLSLRYHPRLSQHVSNYCLPLLNHSCINRFVHFPVKLFLFIIVRS